MGREQRPRWPVIVRRTALGVVSVLVLSVTGYAWTFYRDFSTGLTTSSALNGDEPKSKDGATNILIMGLDSRLDQNGNPLPKAIYDQLHAGDDSNGGYNTNVMMVLHVPNDGSKATLISIPRDDYATLVGAPDGIAKEKIKQGYGLAKDAKEKQLAAQGVSDRATLEQQGREAGRKQTVDDARAFLGGIPIDHFVEVTLVGFYDLAQALGSITVCLQGPTQDSFSGANFQKGVQQLNAAQALAFVRQRRDYVHPELNFTDLDRERRQQAFLASASQQLKSAGTLADPAKMSALVDAAKKDIVFDSGFDLLSFIQQSSSLVGGGVTYVTLPIKTFGQINGEDVNLVDLNQIRTMVRTLVGGTPPPPTTLPAVTVNVVNANGQAGLAGDLEAALVGKGAVKGVASSGRSMLSQSTVYYGTGGADAANAVGTMLGIDDVESDTNVAAGTVRVVVGTDFSMPAALTAPTSTAPTSAAPPAPSSSTAPPATSSSASGPMDALQGGSVPCVK
ncbi:LCP family protein [Kutzneria sp. CA-103260]|uniref:LCP family protein n=1 Tax=Kutzneria sp. CA-103260 TaxID=2802641 RepID=UPI001BF014CD|nr:LCP family protein [Kutzneria sp. CA-103260]QUQ64019.1 cell envelope-related function transcriptional attenuator [Kutzneria sp. CA-103260]